jgi:hypothetical protein
MKAKLTENNQPEVQDVVESIKAEFKKDNIGYKYSSREVVAIIDKIAEKYVKIC